MIRRLAIRCFPWVLVRRGRLEAKDAYIEALREQIELKDQEIARHWDYQCRHKYTVQHLEFKLKTYSVLEKRLHAMNPKWNAPGKNIGLVNCSE